MGGRSHDIRSQFSAPHPGYLEIVDRLVRAEQEHLQKLTTLQAPVKLQGKMKIKKPGIP